MLSKNIFSKAILIALPLFMSYAANASLTAVGDLIQVSVNIIGYKNNGDIKNINDCSGYFGQGFTECEITHVPSGSEEVFATIMGKFDSDNPNENDFASGSSVTDWTFNGTSSHTIGNANSGSWAYTGSAYPGVSFWVAKGGNQGFILNWMVSQSSVTNSDCVDGSEFSISCLSVSIAVSSGSWAAPEPHNISHISFYGNKCENDCTTTHDVPEPASIALFGLALLGIAARRKNSAS